MLRIWICPSDCKVLLPFVTCVVWFYLVLRTPGLQVSEMAQASTLHNAKLCQAAAEEHGSFCKFLWPLASESIWVWGFEGILFRLLSFAFQNMVIFPAGSRMKSVTTGNTWFLVRRT